MRRRSSILIIPAVLVLLTAGTGCLKDTPSTDLTHLGTVIEMMYPGGAQDNGVGTGMEFFSGDQITFGFLDVADTVWYYGNIAGPNTLSKPLTTGIAVDDSALQDNYANDGLTYLPLPDSCYKLVQTSQTIPAGSRIDTFAIVIYPNKIDLTQNYGLPIQLSAPGYTVAANFSIMYLHTLGAPIGGIYNQSSVIYYDSAGATGPTPPTSNQVGPAGPTVFTPLDNADIEVPSGDSTGISYVISFTNTNGVASGFSVSIDPGTLPAHSAIIGGPTLIAADPVAKTYTINYIVGYNNDAVQYNITDTFTYISNN
jgi:Domain of unknown function (DUF1735)